MTEFQAAVLLAQLERLPIQTAQRERSAMLLNERLTRLPGLRLIRPEPRMTRRSYHMYVFRVDEHALGVSRDRFVEALKAEGVPVTCGWYHPLYANGIFQKSATASPHGITSPLSGRGLSYTHVRCRVAEQVCRDAVWIPQNVLLAPESDILAAAEAIEKVIIHAKDVR